VSGRRPKWRDVRRFCENEGFDLFSSDHEYYDKTFPGGETAGTKISRGVEGETLDPGMWHMVWKRQLRVKSERDFWRGVRGESVTYDIPAPPPLPEPLPEYLRRYLANVEHLDEPAIAYLSPDEARERYQRHLARAMRPPPSDG
jgi:hypothetical protein